MDALPFELHAQIFEFACTDDGSTAHALSLVSRYVRDVSAPYRFQSLVIMGSKQMEKLASRFDVTPPHLRRVRHVFLSDRTCVQREDCKLRPRGEEELDRYEAERALALRVLALITLTVETLAVEVSCIPNSTALLGALFSMTMPRLTDLSVYGFYPFPHTPRTMPRLERLHLSGHPNPNGLFQLGALDAACPSLKDIRISGLVGAVGTAAVLLDALFRTGQP
ncbi:hypothetical protein BD413DRAFT_433106, partial [Trametes elegans]